MKKLRSLVFLFVLLGVSLVLRFFAFEVFILKSNSMLPNLMENDFLLVNKLAYGIREPFNGVYLKRYDQPSVGDVVLFHSEMSTAKPFVKRIVAGPGDEVTYRGGKLYVNGELRSSGEVSFKDFIKERESFELPGEKQYYVVRKELGVDNDYDVLSYEFGKKKVFGPLKVRENEYFVLGDFRPVSRDSRFFGNINIHQIVGRVGNVLFSCSDTLEDLPLFCRPNQVRWNRVFTKTP